MVFPSGISGNEPAVLHCLGVLVINEFWGSKSLIEARFVQNE